MAAKLKSISRQIHWSLLLKAAVFAVAWFLLPFWLFLLIAFYLYFIPLFQSRRSFWPFFALLVLTYLEPAELIYLIIFAALFYYLLLIKNLLLIDRRSAYEILIVALSFFLIRIFYGHLGTAAITGAGVWYALLTAVLIGLLVHSFVRRFEGEGDIGPKGFHGVQARRAAAWLTFVLVWQFLLLGLFLPLDFVYQSIAVFLVAVIVIDLIPEQRTLATGAIVGGLLALVLMAARWGL